MIEEEEAQFEQDGVVGADHEYKKTYRRRARRASHLKQQWELFGKYDWAKKWKEAGDYMEGVRLPWEYKLN